MKTLTLGLAFALALLSFAHTSHAGIKYTPGAGCNSSTTGGTCTGTMAGFAASANGDNFSEFVWYNANAVEFEASFNGQYYSCIINSSSQWWPMVPVLMNLRGYFSVYWDKTGNCTSIMLENVSWYSLQ